MQSTRHIGLALLVFTVFCVVAFVLALLSKYSDYGWADELVDLGQIMGRLIFTALAATYIIVEGGSMLSEWFKKARFEEGREEGRQQGRQEGRQEGRQLERAEWMAYHEKLELWENRREEAQKAGQTFNEPRPERPRQSE